MQEGTGTVGLCLTGSSLGNGFDEPQPRLLEMVRPAVLVEVVLVPQRGFVREGDEVESVPSLNVLNGHHPAHGVYSLRVQMAPPLWTAHAVPDGVLAGEVEGILIYLEDRPQTTEANAQATVPGRASAPF